MRNVAENVLVITVSGHGRPSVCISISAETRSCKTAVVV